MLCSYTIPVSKTTCLPCLRVTQHEPDDLRSAGPSTWQTPPLPLRAPAWHSHDAPPIRISQRHTSRARQQSPEGPSTRCLRTLVPKTIKSMGFGARVLKYWELEPSGKEMQGDLGWGLLAALEGNSHLLSPCRSKTSHLLQNCIFPENSSTGFSTGL